MITHLYLHDLYDSSFQELINSNFVDNRTLKVHITRTATIIPCTTTGPSARGGVIDESGNYIGFSGFDTLSDVDRYNPPVDSDCQNAARDTSLDNAIYLGFVRRHWGHFLIDSLSRLWYAIKENSSAPLLYFGEKIPDKGTDADLLRLIGVDLNRLIYIDHPVTVSHLCIPEPSLIPGRYVTPEFLSVFNLAVDNAINRADTGRTWPSKIYLSRCRLPSHLTSEFGEDPIEDIYRRNNYSIIYPETLPLTEQICYLSHASKIAFVSGTLGHTLLFAKEDTDVTILRKSVKQNYRQIMVNQIKNLRVTYVDIYVQLASVDASGPFCIVVNNHFFDYCRDNGMHLSEKSFYARKNKSVLFQYRKQLLLRLLKRCVKRQGKMENYLFSEQHQFDLKVSDKLLRKYYCISSSKTQTGSSHAKRV